jgi:hypothetical protein
VYAAVDIFLVKSVLHCRGLQTRIHREAVSHSFPPNNHTSLETEQTANWNDDESDGFVSVLHLFTLRFVGLRFPPKGVFLSLFSLLLLSKYVAKLRVLAVVARLARSSQRPFRLVRTGGCDLPRTSCRSVSRTACRGLGSAVLDTAVDVAREELLVYQRDCGEVRRCCCGYIGDFGFI